MLKDVYTETIIFVVIFICLTAYILKRNNNKFQISEEIVQNISQNEINNHQEDQEIEEENNNLTFLDNRYINTLIFLIFFVYIVIYFLGILIPADRIKIENGKRFVIEPYYIENNEKKLKKQHIFYKTGYLKCEKSFYFRNFFYVVKIGDEEQQITEENLKFLAANNDKKVFKYYIDEETSKKEINEKNLSGNFNKKQKLDGYLKKFGFCDEFKKNSEIVKKFKIPNYILKNVDFKNIEITFFNLRNFIAFLLNCSYFFIIFFIPYLVFHFLYAFVYSLFFIKENKLLFAFRKTRKAILFLNIQGFLKIFPIIGFFSMIFSFFVFFFLDNEYKLDHSDFHNPFVPILFDIEEKKIMKFEDNFRNSFYHMFNNKEERKFAETAFKSFFDINKKKEEFVGYYFTNNFNEGKNVFYY